MVTLDQHLEMLERQNTELEHELKDIVQGDEQIKQRLRSKSPEAAKVRF